MSIARRSVIHNPFMEPFVYWTMEPLTCCYSLLLMFGIYTPPLIFVILQGLWRMYLKAFRNPLMIANCKRLLRSLHLRLNSLQRSLQRNGYNSDCRSLSGFLPKLRRFLMKIPFSPFDTRRLVSMRWRIRSYRSLHSWRPKRDSCVEFLWMQVIWSWFKRSLKFHMRRRVIHWRNGLRKRVHLHWHYLKRVNSCKTITQELTFIFMPSNPRIIFMCIALIAIRITSVSIPCYRSYFMRMMITSRDKRMTL